MLYVRQCAWLNTAPDRAEGDKSTTPVPSRRRDFEERGITPTYPDCEAQYLAQFLFEIGPTMSAGMGDGPITYTEIESWVRNTSTPLDAWEVRTLRRLSMVYLEERHRARDRLSEAPYSTEQMDDQKRAAIAAHINQVIGAAAVRA